MIQRTAIWILTTLAMCSPGALPAGSVVQPLGSSYVLWAVRVRPEAAERRQAQLPRLRAASIRLPFKLVDDVRAFASPLVFGSLYNRPPPALLSFV